MRSMAGGETSSIKGIVCFFCFQREKTYFSVVVHTQCKSTRKCVRNYRQVKINSNEKKKEMIKWN